MPSGNILDLIKKNIILVLAAVMRNIFDQCIGIRNHISCRLEIEIEKETGLAFFADLFTDLLQQNRFTAPSYSSDYFNKVAIVKRSYLPDVVFSDNHASITVQQYYIL